jgi:hypothetical protein
MDTTSTDNNDASAAADKPAQKTYSNPQMAREICGWPLGRHDRAIARFTVETHPKRGQRAVRVITDPLTGKTFAPKALTYNKRVRIVDGSDGRTYIVEEHFSGSIEVMQGTMKYSEEYIGESDPRHAAMLALFEEEVTPERTDNDAAAFDWGRSVGEIQRINDDQRDDKPPVDLTSSERAEYQRGHATGYNEPRGGTPCCPTCKRPLTAQGGHNG